MMSSDFQNPPRNGEGNREAVEGSLSTGAMAQAENDLSVSPRGLPPPRPGADRRSKHSTLGAPDTTIRNARKLRRQMTLPEVLLWQQLRQHPDGYLFRKQHPIASYVIDFACIRARLAIEIDGEAHRRGDRPRRDSERDIAVKKLGFETIRIPAVDVLNNLEGVLTLIVQACKAKANPSPLRSREQSV